MVTINYEEFNPDYTESYHGVFSQGRQFHTGDVVKDFADAVVYDMQYSGKDFVLYSSTVDNFIEDVPGFFLDDNKMIARIIDEE